MLTSRMGIGAVHGVRDDIDLVAVAEVHRDAEPVGVAECEPAYGPLGVLDPSEHGELRPLVHEDLPLRELRGDPRASLVETDALRADGDLLQALLTAGTADEQRRARARDEPS